MKSSSIKFYTSKSSMMTLAITIGLVFIICLSTSPAFAQSSSEYSKGQVPVPVQRAVILQVRDATVETPTAYKAVGGVLGGALGALVGAQLSKNSTSGSYLISSALGSIGALGGALIADKAAVAKAQEIVFVQDDGKVFSIAQSSADGQVFMAGQKVMVLNGRVIPAMN